MYPMSRTVRHDSATYIVYPVCDTSLRGALKGMFMYRWYLVMSSDLLYRLFFEYKHRK